MLIAFPRKPLTSNGLSCSSLVSPEKSLKIALARIQRTRPARIIFIAWPNLEASCVKLARAVTHLCPSVTQDGGYLLDDALQRAIDAYEKCSETSRVEEDMAFAFLRELIDIGSQIIEFDVHLANDAAETVGWPHYEIPLHDWVKRNRGVEIVFNRRGGNTEKERSASMVFMASQLCSIRILAKMGLAGHLQGVA